MGRGVIDPDPSLLYPARFLLAGQATDPDPFQLCALAWCFFGTRPAPPPTPCGLLSPKGSSRTRSWPIVARSCCFCEIRKKGCGVGVGSP